MLNSVVLTNGIYVFMVTDKFPLPLFKTVHSQHNQLLHICFGGEQFLTETRVTLRHVVSVWYFTLACGDPVGSAVRIKTPE